MKYFGKAALALMLLSGMGLKAEVIYSDWRTYHLGDENFRSRKWAPLYGDCYLINFNHYRRGARYYLTLQYFGVESAIVSLNGDRMEYLSPQYRGYRKRPNYWSSRRTIPLPPSMVRWGMNELSICALPVTRPEFPGDVDDFQIRNIELIAE